MISRVAESCFWLNRYVERVEVMARLLNVNLSFQLDVELPNAERWRPLVIVTGQKEAFLKDNEEAVIDDGEVVQNYLVWSEKNPSSLFSSLRAARENARTIRETISLEMFETLNDLWVWLGERSTRKLYKQDRHAFYVKLRDQCLLYHGIAAATMLHEDPFEFMRLGTSIERADQTARILDVKYHSVGPSRGNRESPAEAAQWIATLRSCSGVEPFFKTEDAVLSGPAVAGFLLFHPAFPRSVLHSLVRARNFLALVRPPQPSQIGDASRAIVNDLIDRLESLTIETVMEREAGLHELLTWIVHGCGEFGQSIRSEFFDPTIHRTPTQGQSQRQGPA